MTKPKRTAAALKALAIKRNIPKGFVSIQVTIQLPLELVARIRSATPVGRGEIMAAGVRTIELEKANTTGELK